MARDDAPDSRANVGGPEAEGEPAFGDPHRAQLRAVRRDVVPDDGLGVGASTVVVPADPVVRIVPT